MAGAAPEEGGPLIERDVLFGNPERAAVRLSPDGKTLSYSAPLDGVMNLWVAPIDDVAAAKAVTADTGRGITNYFWAYTNRHLVYLQDDGGNENNNLYVVDLDTGETRPLDVDENVRAQISGVSKDKPTTILVGLNRRSPMFHDLYTVDLESGEQTLHFAHPGMIDGRMVAGLTTDPDYAVRFATVFNNDGGLTVFQADDADEGVDWQDYETIAFEDSLGSGLAGFTDDGQTLYAISSKGRDTAALYAIDPDSDERTLLAADERADVGGSLSDPQTGQVQAVSFNYDKPRWEILDDAVAPDVAYLDDLAGNAEWGVTSRTLDDATWMVYVSPSDGPTQYYLYDRSGESPQATPLFTNNPKLEGLDLRPMTPVVIEARDGLEMVSYLTLPAGVEMGDDGTVTGDPVPAVLVVHGGPWARDSYGYNPLHQWLANRGYAVLSPNFRGSTGFGKSHVNAGNKEWGQAMQDDLTDAKAWLVEQGIAEPDKVAIMGGSYGGYAALAGVTLTPDEYALGVSIVGPSNIKTLLSTIPPYWAPAIKLFHTRVGNPADEADSEMLDAVSPLNHIDKIAVPLLIGQGANDPRVKQSESDQIVEAMQEKGIPVTYVLYPDEGHGFARPENRLSFFGVTEAFLAEHLGGRFQPLGESDVEGSSITVPTGGDGVPGLAEVLETP
jgi:dipeptidyl aminopeptidase/acylaminoacyl peptidase